MAEDGGSQSSGGEIGDRESRIGGSGFKTENEKSNAQSDYKTKSNARGDLENAKSEA